VGLVRQAGDAATEGDCTLAAAGATADPVRTDQAWDSSAATRTASGTLRNMGSG